MRLGLLVNEAAAKRIPDGLMAYVLGHSGPQKIGESAWAWPNTVAGRALMAEYAGTGNPAAAEVLKNYLLGAYIGGGRDGMLAEEALFCTG